MNNTLPEQQPVFHQYQSTDGSWHGFIDARHQANTMADDRWTVRALYTTPQALVPTCNHRLADATNTYVQSGYMCVDCGALFGAFNQHPSSVPAVSDAQIGEALRAWLSQKQYSDIEKMRAALTSYANSLVTRQSIEQHNK